MKCQYCGSNLGFENECCPHCGKINIQAASHVAEVKEIKEELEKTEQVVGKKVKLNNRTSRVFIILVLVGIIVLAEIGIRVYSNIELREKINNKKRALEVQINYNDISATLKDMELNRDYLAMSNYILEYSLRNEGEYYDYSRVFTAAIEYEGIYNDIISITCGYNYFGEKNQKDWCDELANNISSWNQYVDGYFWHDLPDSPMLAGEHGAFLTDAKKDAQDMVQLYFDLTDEQAANMWSMEREEISTMLYEKCRDLYPEVDANE